MLLWVLLSATQSLFWFFGFGFVFVFVVASAICFRYSRVAPVRGGTYFLCRRKESKQRKRAHTASPCAYPRAPNVPVFHTPALRFFFVASASNARLTRFNHSFNSIRHRLTCAHLRQTVCRLSRREARCACQKTFCAPTFVVRQATHSLPQRGRERFAEASCCTGVWSG